MIPTTNVTRVECSCGKMTDLRFDPSAMSRDGKPGGRWIPDNPAWKFRDTTAPDAETKRLGWYCGNPDHEQRTL